MQTKKRAKSVKFGKRKEESETAGVKKQQDQKKAIEPKTVTDSTVATPEEQPEATKEVIINEPGAEEIKKKIAEKINPKEEDDSESSEPKEVNLTSELHTNQEEAPETPTSEMAEEKNQTSSFGSFTKDFDEPKQGKNNLVFFLIVVLVTFIVGLVAIGGFYYFSNTKTPSPTPTPTAVAPTIEPSPTEEPADLSGFTIEVLNGSGVSGVAAKVKTQLTDAGFTVDSVGNGDKSDYTKTIIAAKENVDETFIGKLTEELEKIYLIEEKIEVLPDTSETDVVVTIRSETAE